MKIYRTHKEILGAFANWITRQTPFFEDVSPALIGIEQALVNRKDKMDVAKFNNKNELQIFVNSCVDIESVKRLNVSRAAQRGEKTPDIMFTSRYDTPKPDYDFVDLDALRRNVFIELSKDEEHTCCDGECNHDDCCGKIVQK